MVRLRVSSCARLVELALWAFFLGAAGIGDTFGGADGLWIGLLAAVVFAVLFIAPVLMLNDIRERVETLEKQGKTVTSILRDIRDVADAETPGATSGAPPRGAASGATDPGATSGATPRGATFGATHPASGPERDDAAADRQQAQGPYAKVGEIVKTFSGKAIRREETGVSVDGKLFSGVLEAERRITRNARDG